MISRQKIFQKIISFIFIIFLIPTIFAYLNIPNVMAGGEPKCGTEGNESFNVKACLNNDKIKYSYLDPDSSTNKAECEGISPVACFIIRVIRYLSGIIATACFAVIVVGGLIMVTSQGAENQTTKGKELITNALIGLVISLSAYVITLFIQSIFYT